MGRTAGVARAEASVNVEKFKKNLKRKTLHLLASQQTWTKTNGLNLLKRKL